MTFKKKNVISGSIKSVSFQFTNGGINCITHSDVELTVEGFSKLQHTVLMHAYCPFCGKPTTKETEENSNDKTDQP